jgi:hypothetical protein
MLEQNPWTRAIFAVPLTRRALSSGDPDEHSTAPLSASLVLEALRNKLVRV